jgi:hypothetical protein
MVALQLWKMKLFFDADDEVVEVKKVN